jgi:hypothetical protein
MKEVMTYDFAKYLDIGTESTPSIKLMNVGVTKADESSNPTEKSTQYIGDKSKSNKVTGYDNQYAIESDLIKDEDVVMDLYSIFRDRKAGADAQRILYDVELWNPATTYELTSDSAIVTGKTYYTRSGSEGSYVYTPVATPTSAGLSSYYEVVEVANTYKARKLKVSVVITGTTENPGETVTFTGDLKGIGDFVDGTFNTSTKEFTPNL